MTAGAQLSAPAGPPWNGRVLHLDDHARLIDALREIRPELILDFCNAGYRNRSELQLHAPALLEMLGHPFAGADAACLAICHDKAAVHAAATAAGVPTPRQELLALREGAAAVPRRYPALLKPNDGSGSEGIEPASIVRIPAQALERLSALRLLCRPPAGVVAEELLPRREITLALLGPAEPGGAPLCLAPLEVDCSRLPQSLPQILTHAAKSDETSVYRRCTALRPAEIAAPAREAVEDHARRLFERLGCRDYARFDFRADAEGMLRLIDANAHPEWGAESMVGRMAAWAGLAYPELLARIMESARARRASAPAEGRRPCPGPS
ncbi:MAG: D-alanine--D-alanine ligase [Pseudomonadota bacterium]